MNTEDRQQLVTSAQIMYESGDSISQIAERLGVSENDAQTLVINWGYNCLTVGVHHGRPEKLWNLPLFQAAYMFGKEELKELVLARIYNDAMQFVNHGGDSGEGVRSQEWAEKVRAHAEEAYMRTLQYKVGEISRYYQSPEWKRQQQDVVQRVKENKLNPHFEPRHLHDSINMLCRILGTSGSVAVS